MVRRHCLQGWCAVCFGLGLLVGHSLESWLLSVLGGLALMGFGLCCVRRK